MDILQGGFEFASKLVQLLNQNGITQEKDAEPYCAVLVVACPAMPGPDSAEPVGFSLNFDHEKQQWRLDEQAQGGERIELPT